MKMKIEKKREEEEKTMVVVAARRGRAERTSGEKSNEGWRPRKTFVVLRLEVIGERFL